MSLNDSQPADLRATVQAMQEIIEQHGELLDKLAEFFGENRPTLAEIISEVGDFYAVSRLELVGTSHQYRFSHPRLIVYYLARKLTRLSLHNIADRLGMRDHSTVAQGFQSVVQRLRKDEILRDDLDVLRFHIAERVLTRQQQGRVS
jgi:chromosomal replication initiation ATPase DnaA